MPVGLVVEQPSPEADSLVASFRNSRFFTVRLARHRAEVEDDLVSGRLKGVVVLAADFAERLGRGETAPVQVLVDGSDPNTAGLVAELRAGRLGELAAAGVRLAGQPCRPARRPSPWSWPSRGIWFNPEIDSRELPAPRRASRSS